MKAEGFGYTFGRQGGIGYPPAVVKIKGRWYQVTNSRNHGGTFCRVCNGSCKLWDSIQRREDTVRRFLNRKKSLNKLPNISIEEVIEAGEKK